MQKLNVQTLYHVRESIIISRLENVLSYGFESQKLETRKKKKKSHDQR